MKVNRILFIIVAIVIVAISCRKSPEIPEGGNKIEIGQSVVDNIGYFESKIITTITDLGGNSISQHGHCWSLTENPTIADFKTSKGAISQAASYYSDLTSLTANTKYYIRPYLTYAQGTVYGSQLSITTLQTGKPVVSTKAITSITLYTAISGGTVTSDGGLTVAQRGICWSTEQDFDLATSLSNTSNGTGLGIYTSNLIDLLEGTTYYVEAYATNAAGTSYGQTLSFTTTPITTPTVTTAVVSNITINSAQSGGNVTSNGNGTLTARGIVWSTNQNPTIEINTGITNNGSDLGTFTSELTNLTDGETNFVKAYATNEKGTSYGDSKEFSTTGILSPTVSTLELSSITTNSAEAGGNVLNANNGTISARGIVWSTSQSPTIENNEGITSDGDGIGEFTSSLTDLSDGTTYYVRAYATNEKGTGYGNEIEFSTIGVSFPTITTSEITNITTNSAESGGNVADAGNGTISAVGIVWSTNQSPTIENNEGITTDGSELGEFTSSLTDLSNGTTYYVRSYATNEKGTAYGEEKEFSTIEILSPTVTTTDVTNITTNSAVSGGNVTDAGNGTISSRGIVWSTNQSPTLESNEGKTSDGDGIGEFTSNQTNLTEGTTYYVRAYATNENVTSYGDEKQFIAIIISIPSVSTDEIFNITTVSAEISGNLISANNGTITARGVVWSINQNPTVESNLGITNEGTDLGAFTSAITGLSDGVTYYVRAYSTNEKGTAYGDEKQFSTLELTTPTVTTADITNITSNSAESGGNVIDDGNGTVIAKGIVWSTNQNPTIDSNEGITSDGEGIGSFISNLTGLLEGTTYSVRAYATNEKGTSYGQALEFTAVMPCGQLTVVYGGQTYNTVLIGVQCWMKENLNIGALVNGNMDVQDNQTIEKYCYNDDESNCDVYGGLYQWDEVMQYSTIEGSQGICPDGWHIPSDTDWTEFTDFLINNGYGYEGSGDDIGKSMASISSWDTSLSSGAVGYDQATNNSSGFTALSGGRHDTFTSIFQRIGSNGYWWSSSEASSLTTKSWHLYFDYDFLRYTDYNKGYGFSVRCIKD
jgi:uncharacterized protein (TIGR02145 family)